MESFETLINGKTMIHSDIRWLNGEENAGRGGTRSLKVEEGRCRLLNA